MPSKQRFNSGPVMRTRWISDVMAIFSAGLLNYSTVLMNDGGKKSVVLESSVKMFNPHFPCHIDHSGLTGGCLLGSLTHRILSSETDLTLNKTSLPLNSRSPR